jgi:hypothetical protein
MKKYMTALVLLAGLGVLVASPAAVAEPESVFEKFRALAGEWEGQRTGGGSVKVSYQVLSGGSAVVEILTELAEEVTMVTVYHMDGNDLRMTHYCSAQNQPRMKASSVSRNARVVSFEFVDVTNLARPPTATCKILKSPSRIETTSPTSGRGGRTDARRITSLPSRA